MATIELTKTELVVRIHGWNRLLAMRGSLRVPLGHVRSVRLRPMEAHFDDVIIETYRGIGTYAPHHVAAGLVYLRTGASFFEVRDPERAIAVDVEGERIFGHPVHMLVVQVDRESPEAAMTRIVDAANSYLRHAAHPRRSLSAPSA